MIQKAQFESFLKKQSAEFRVARPRTRLYFEYFSERCVQQDKEELVQGLLEPFMKEVPMNDFWGFTRSRFEVMFPGEVGNLNFFRRTLRECGYRNLTFIELAHVLMRGQLIESWLLETGSPFFECFAIDEMPTPSRVLSFKRPAVINSFCRMYDVRIDDLCCVEGHCPQIVLLTPLLLGGLFCFGLRVTVGQIESNSIRAHDHAPLRVIMKKTALLIDGNAMIHRVWHVLPPMHDPKGRLVNAAYGFTSILMRLLPSRHPDYLVVCWDRKEATYRHEAAPEYKAQREEQPQEFYDQIPMTQELVEVFGGHNSDLKGYEADDLLATLALRMQQQGIEVSILTSDRDMWQMIRPGISVVAFQKGVTETIVYDEAMVLEKTGLRPDQIADYKAMRGDSSDNLKGIPGVGEKTATELLQQFGNLDAILAAAHDEMSAISPAVRKKLIAGEEAARSTYPLVTLMMDAPIEKDAEHWKRAETDPAKAEAMLLAYGFKSLAVRLGVKAKDKINPKKEEPANLFSGSEEMKVAKEVDVVLAKKSLGFGERIKVENDAQARKELADFFGKEVVIRSVVIDQASLLAENTGLVLGMRTKSVFIPSSLLKHKSVEPIMRELLADSKTAKLGHDLKTVMHWALGRDWKIEGIAFDVEIVAYLLAAGEGGTDLPSLAAARLGLNFSDGDQRVFEEAEAILGLTDELRREMADMGIVSVFERFELPLIPVLVEMEAWGILIDRPYFQSLNEDFRKEKEKLEKEMRVLAGEDFNPGSSQQLAHILFEVLKLPVKGIKRGKTGLSTAAPELEKLEGTHPIIEKISAFREVAKLLSTYVEVMPLLADKDGRVHTTFKQTIAATGRLSSIDPNLQNIPIRTELGRKIRRGFIAKPGFVLLSCDYSQIELRVIAALAKDKRMLEAFEQGLDIHTATAAAIWHVSLDEVTKDQRRAAKAINFGIIYGQGPHGLAKTAGISFEDAKNFIQEYFNVYSGIRDYLEETKVLARERGYVETLFGRRRPIPEINSPLHQLRAAAERMAINMPVQGTATGDLVKLALIEIAKKLPDISPKTRMLLQVHDEVVLEVPEAEVKKVAKAVRDIMENVEKIGCPIVADAKVGKNWEEMERIKD